MPRPFPPRVDVLIIALAFIMAVSAGCAAENEPLEEVTIEEEALYFEPIGYGQRAAISDTVETVLRTRDAWEIYRDSLRPIAPFDSVDFAQVDVLLAALPQTTSGYSVEFVSVDRLDSVIVAEYVVGVPSEDCLTAFAESVPFQAALVRKTDLPVRFERSEEEYRCTFGPPRR